MKGDDHVAKGVFLAVTYSITNEATTALRPDIHVAGAFSLADDKGRISPVAMYSTHHFPVSTVVNQQLWDRSRPERITAVEGQR